MSSPSIGTVAAVDLGSNSFHLIVANASDGRLQVVDKMREMVRLAAGLDARNHLTADAMERALACLRRFGQRLREIPQGNVRAVGTNTLRRARNAREFLEQAEEALGHPIGIIAGREEARLIYLGVSHSIEDDSGRRLVIDIGGGSTEFILGRHFRSEQMESLYMGCVGFSTRFFADGAIDDGAMRSAEIAAHQELETIAGLYRREGWESVYGASGTFLAIRDVVLSQGWSKEGITPESLRKLRKTLIDTGHIDKIKLSGLSAERAPVFPGGVAIAQAVFEALGIERMRVSSGALREGALYDLLGRKHREDVRERTVDDLLVRYHIDPEQARRVEETAAGLLGQVARDWDLERDEAQRCLRWAARLHEIGLVVAHNQYHKHGAYLIRNFDMPGFSQGEQMLLAALIRSHRRKFSLTEFRQLDEDTVTAATRLAVLLRLAALLHRSRAELALPAIEAGAKDQHIRLRFPPGWLEQHPLTRADLQSEAEYLKLGKFRLSFE